VKVYLLIDSKMKSRTFCARLAVLPLAVATAFPVMAQTTVPETVSSLRAVVVTASRIATPVTDVIADVTVIDRVALDLAGQASLRDILAQQPGVQMSSTGSYRSATGIFLRGAANNQTVVLIDGVRVGSASSGAASLDTLPLERIERIEILRGASTALYGADAIGGVIQIFTRQPSDQLSLSASIGAGSDGQQQASASVRGSAGAIGYSLGVSNEKATGISVGINPASASYNPDADSFNTTSFDARLTAKLDQRHNLSLSVLQSQSEYQFDGTAVGILPLTKLTTDARAKPQLNNATFSWEAQWLDAWKSTLTLGTSDDVSVNEYYRLADGAFSARNKFNTKRTQVTWQNDLTVGRDVLSAMLESRTEALDSSTVYPVKDRTINSALVSYTLNRDDWNALAVLRNDSNSQFGSQTNWALSAGYRMTASLRAVASLGSSFQAPTFNQLYFPGFGNALLLPQLSRTSEVGLKYSQGGLTMNAVTYNNEIKNYINSTTNVQNLSAVLRGVTLSGDVKVGATSYSVSYDYADPRTYSAVAAANDLRVVRIAQNVLNARVAHQWGDVNLFGELKLSSDREDAKVVGAGRDTLAGYGTLNLGLNWRINKDVSLLARVNNLTDTQYMLANGFSVPGRNVFVSASWSM
jgi:vitamin B12 transporter